VKDYNLLEFVGDSIIDFFVVDFYYRHSNTPELSKIYGHDQIHRLKTELTNNNFLSIMMIEMDLH
jgi:dsRNA-specific ribonuclease